MNKKDDQTENLRMVPVIEYIDDISFDMKYSTTDNFTGKVIYDFSQPWLRYGTVKKLLYAQSLFREKGFRLKIWDAFRPIKAQFVMWEVYPNDDFVADPTKGFSNHSRGNTVDITLTDMNGVELKMPTGFDCFEDMAKYDYSNEENRETAQNALMLREIMIKSGFRPSTTEWWHYGDTDVYPVDKDFLPSK